MKKDTKREMKIMKKRLKEIETELSCKFIRINPDEENFSISKVNNKRLKYQRLK